jgi:hypothetical protein
VSLREVLDRRDYKEWDDHWNECGHRKVADVMAKLYREKVKVGVPQQGAAVAVP